MAAATSVGLSRKNWQASLQTHFAYPNKDNELVKLYKEVMEEYRKGVADEHLKTVNKDSMGPAWRWLILRDADIEDKMVQIVQKGDRSLYHKIKAYEQAKTLDKLSNDFSIDMDLLLIYEKHYKLTEEEHTIDFE